MSLEQNILIITFVTVCYLVVVLCDVLKGSNLKGVIHVDFPINHGVNDITKSIKALKKELADEKVLVTMSNVNTDITIKRI